MVDPAREILLSSYRTISFPRPRWPARAQASQETYAPLCGGRLYLRNRAEGHKTTLEWATDFLRRYVPGGERITSFVREKFYRDAFLDTSEVIPAKSAGAGAARPQPTGTPVPPLLNPLYADHYLIPHELGIELQDQTDGRVLVGRWYRVKDIPGVFVSTIQPKLTSEEVVRTQQARINSLDEVEASALVYLVAFDLSRFEVGFAMGTEHPRVDWSPRVRPEVKDNALPGPDGIGTVAPLVNTGMVSPLQAGRVTATFVGGFKRYHSAFRWGDLSIKNHGSHYGFVENGVVMSKLQPGLATAVIYADGRVYRDWLDITPGEAYKLFLKEPDSFRTAAPSPEDCLQALRRASQRASNILAVTVSLSISTVYNVVREAAGLAKTELPGFFYNHT